MCKMSIYFPIKFDKNICYKLNWDQWEKVKKKKKKEKKKTKCNIGSDEANNGEGDTINGKRDTNNNECNVDNGENDVDNRKGEANNNIYAGERRSWMRQTWLWQQQPRTRRRKTKTKTEKIITNVFFYSLVKFIDKYFIDTFFAINKSSIILIYLQILMITVVVGQRLICWGAQMSIMLFFGKILWSYAFFQVKVEGGV